MDVVYLKKGREKPILNKNLWIFSGAVRNYPEFFINGDIAQVRSHDNKVLGYAYFNTDTSIAGRMISFSNKQNFDPKTDLRKNTQNAVHLRLGLINSKYTDAYRVINGEGDSVPGIIVDRYNDILVVQVSTVGMERLKSTVIEEVLSILNKKRKNIRLVYEKSLMGARKIEGLHDIEYTVWRDDTIQKQELKTEIKENGNKFEIDIKNSHKTGFYLDQRNMRDYVSSLIYNKSLLNCFSYTGGFSVYAAKANASKVDSVDISEEVIDQAKENFRLNNLNLKGKKYEFFAEDVFKYLDRQKSLDYDMVILDPPAFAKKKSDFKNACNGYRGLNTLALSKMKKGSYLLTCSCSYHVDEDTFLKLIYQSAKSANRDIKILSKHRLAEDHTLNLYHGDMDYLKSFLLWVE